MGIVIKGSLEVVTVGMESEESDHNERMYATR
jgi:hypothetical protein